jgi:hypothetical protein
VDEDQQSLPTAGFVKGLLTLNPHAFTRVPPDMTAYYLREPAIWKFSSVFVLAKLWHFSSVKKSATLGYVVGVSFHRKLSLTFENLNWSANKSKPLSLSDHSLKRKVLEVSPW